MPPIAAPATKDFLADLHFRGLVHQCTNEPELAKHLADPATQPRRAYVGFDPTSDSLTVGNLLPLTLLRRFQLAGHVPVVVMGGGTGMIGDPSGKSSERELQTIEKIAANVQAQRRIYDSVVDFTVTGAKAPLLLNNLDWLGKLSFLEVLRDVGKHFSVNMMIQKDSVRERLNARDQGISYTEFSYMILQSYDYFYLFKNHGVTFQMGGSDQWGNIVAGGDFIRRQQVVCGPQGLSRGTDESIVYGLTAPLVTKSDGTKFGKSESGAVWLTADRTSPYAFYQFWLNASDDDVVKYIKFYTFLSHEQINDLAAKHAANPGAREAHRALASHMTDMLHGEPARRGAEAAAAALFSGNLREVPESMLDEVLAAAPATTHDKASLAAGVALLDLLPQTSIAKSKTEARRGLEEGSISVNGEKATLETRLTTASLLHGRIIAIRRGKKTWHVTRWA